MSKNRKDAKRITDINGMYQLMLDIKPKRCDSDVFINQKMDVTKLVEYVEKKKKEGMEITYFHAFITALAKVLYNRPKLNRFVQNRHVYEHNDVVISFVAKISFDDRSEEMMLMVPIEKDDNILSISKKIKEMVDEITRFLKGDESIVIDKINKEMEVAINKLNQYLATKDASTPGTIKIVGDRTNLDVDALTTKNWNVI